MSRVATRWHPFTPLERWEWWTETGKFAEADGGCWVWTGALTHSGYAQTKIRRKSVYIHRLMYELVVADIPAGLDLDHLCRVRNCVNPWHLEPVTRSVNLQ